MKLLIIFFSILSFEASSQNENPEKNVRYEYKKYEKFDFETIGVEGEAGAPGDISISPRLRNEFRNKLPERANFNKEMQKSIEVIR